MSFKEIEKPIEILLVEDNLADVRLTQENFKESKIRNNLHVVSDGEEAMAFLRREGKYINAVRPDLIFLDLNLPKKNGREVLGEMKSDNELKQIPIVVLTISDDEEDIFKSYSLHANCYITKPIGLEQFTKVVKSIEDFWLSVVKFPLR
ncbi:MAG: response regulator [Thermodesulfobacteriota bacterium]|nr:response regulator [Thermodesulfobacteriota bacterium]